MYDSSDGNPTKEVLEHIGQYWRERLKLEMERIRHAGELESHKASRPVERK